MPRNRTEGSAARVETNRNIRLAVGRMDAAASVHEGWLFLCECGEVGCREWVTLTLADYETLRGQQEPILVPGHTLARAPRARHRAQELVEDAKALRGQADVQARRAARNLEKPPPG